ncbi:MAG: outer membrane protein assembly factor BamE [Pelagibacterales bacterium]|nr:outer membrane protein assembly factor BamE [Pelagibacterales bacterium]
MKKIFFIIPFILILSCSLNKVVKHHGVHFLDKKNGKLVLNHSNKNDILTLLGEPSTKSTFDNDVWIYIERKTSKGPIYKLGKEILLVNNVLVLEINDMGLLTSKKFYDKEKMNDIEFAENSTDSVYTKRSFVYDFLSSMRQKINDPLGRREKKN